MLLTEEEVEEENQQRNKKKMTSTVKTPNKPSSTNNSISSSSSSLSKINNNNNNNNGRSTKSPILNSNSKRSVTPTSRTTHRSLPSDRGADPESERVRVAVRLRPRTSEDLSDADYTECVEIQPELKRLKLRKNNWSSEAYRFDEVFTESASQKRVYDEVAKPVVESVLDGYNGTIMCYGQTGTGKTYTLGTLGKDDIAKRGIMVRSLEDIMADVSSSDSVEISYLQLYMESVQDLLAPEKINIPIVEDAKTGHVSVPGAEIVKIRNLDHFLQLLQLGESNRHAANTKLNTESSRSHAILMINIRKLVHEKREADGVPTIRKSKLLIVDLAGSERVDKSGSEGHLLEEAKFINLSLTSLGKCINALAENRPHIPTRDSKLTRLLRDSFGGSARTSLIITIGPSYRHHAETASTVMFGQRAMKVVNTVKVKEEFDYEGLCRKLETQVDLLTMEIDRKQKLRDNDRNEMEKKLDEYQISFAQAEKFFVAKSELLSEENNHLTSKTKDLLQELDAQKHRNELLLNEIARLEACEEKCEQQQLENSTSQKLFADTTLMYEEKIIDMKNRIEDESLRATCAEREMERMKNQLSVTTMSMQQNQAEVYRYHKALADTTNMYEEKISILNQQLKDKCAYVSGVEKELRSTKELLQDYQNSVQSKSETEIYELQGKLQDMLQLHERTTNKLGLMTTEYNHLKSEKETLQNELHLGMEKLQVEERLRKEAETELLHFKKNVPESDDGFEEKKLYVNGSINRMASSLHSQQSTNKSFASRETISSQRNTITKICEQVGLEKILSLLQSGDTDVQIHAVKVVANLAAEDMNQERIVQEGGLDALLMLVESSNNTTILRVASGAIANLAMNERNQGLIANKGGAQLLANASTKTDDPQTLRMIAGAIANLCGNGKLHIVLKEEGAIKALLGTTRTGSMDVIAQVARGLANFSKCESRKIMQAGHGRGRSLLMEDGALTWLVANLNTSSTSTRRHIELAICHLAQNEENGGDFMSNGGWKELIEISDRSAREDIRNLAKKTLRLNPLFRGE